MNNPLKLSDVGVGLKAGDLLCVVDDIEDGGAREFSYRSGNDTYDIFIQRQGADIFAYLNVCPHAGSPLNMDEGKFTEKSGQYFMCHTHGALFQISDGLCVAGPCNGARLRAVNIAVENGNILVG